MSRHASVRIAVSLLTASLIATTASAATLPGINIRWDQCFSDGGVMNKTFACNTNTGSEQAILSLQLDSEISRTSGMEIRISLKAAAATLPAWWELNNPGTCRQTSLTFLASPVVTPGACVDWGGGGQIGGIGAYNIDALGPASAVLLTVAAVSQSNLQDLLPVTEYIVGGLRINHVKTVGTGACAGCNVPVCILFTSLNVTQPLGVGDHLFTQGANGVGSQVIHWQNGQLTNLVNHCNGTFDCNTQFDCVLASPTVTRQSTWGAVKSLYR